MKQVVSEMKLRRNNDDFAWLELMIKTPAPQLFGVLARGFLFWSQQPISALLSNAKKEKIFRQQVR